MELLAATTAVLPDQSDDVTTDDLDHESGLYRHEKRPEWGVAILAWEKGPRRAYQFEDGRLRKFREGYYSLMKPVEDVPRGKAIINGLEDALERQKSKGNPKVLEPVCSFEAQVELFNHLYPEGFHDPDWIADHREDEGGRALKRHREPVVAQTREALSKERCDELIASDRHGDLVEAVTEILGGTSLVALKHVKPLKRLDEGETKTFAEAVRDVLHGEEAFDPRFQRYLGVLTEIYGDQPSWRVATALPALMYPQDEVCVRRSAFVRQAASIAPLARYSRKARARSYRNFRRVASVVRDKLKEAGHEPRDFLDVHDFIWATLRKAALEHLPD